MLPAGRPAWIMVDHVIGMPTSPAIISAISSVRACSASARRLRYFWPAPRRRGRPAVERRACRGHRLVDVARGALRDRAHHRFGAGVDDVDRARAVGGDPGAVDVDVGVVAHDHSLTVHSRVPAVGRRPKFVGFCSRSEQIRAQFRPAARSRSGQRCSRYQAIRLAVAVSWSAVVSPVSSGVMTLANSLPSSTPHWS